MIEFNLVLPIEFPLFGQQWNRLVRDEVILVSLEAESKGGSLGEVLKAEVICWLNEFCPGWSVMLKPATLESSFCDIVYKTKYNLPVLSILGHDCAALFKLTWG